MFLYYKVFMFEFMFVLTLIVTTIAGIIDLRTTEVPDEILLFLHLLGLISWGMYSFITLKSEIFFRIISNGTLLLIFAWISYIKGWWGGGDGFLLSGIFFMLPFSFYQVFKFILSFSIISIVYILIYITIVSIYHKRKIKKELSKELYSRPMQYIYIFFILAVICFLISKTISILFFISAFLMFLFIYSKVLEKTIFRKRIPTSELKEGDVLATDIWRGLTKEEIKKLKRNKKYVTIKEGIRFAPVFSITLLLWLIL